MRLYSQEDFQLVVENDGSVKGIKENDYYVKEVIETNSFPSFLRMKVMTHYKLIDGEWVEQD